MAVRLREPVNGLTHCLGAVLALVGAVLLLARVASPAMPWHIVTFAVFGTAMVMLYTASTLYHWLPLSEAGVRLWRRIDHCMIFVYIAATYTPICLIPLRGPWGWSLFGSVWALALAGIFVKVFWLHAPRWLSTGLYLGMGWMVIVGVYPLVVSLPAGALWWLLAGGLFYTVGAVVYASRWPNVARHFGFHELFHVFVMAGSFCHFLVMYLYVSRL
ncbi:PAQR family membrane homeostasis protein TrhA [Nitratidesulfovibrio vulgaris]|uniref:Hemolysin III n=2 Tax=Nitratidesulfovibrio vulgaris TaxID=881 RepID=Q725X9_NITV2|nr:hemolysin III family protein [Nitratidesulfovibrio vulgaris]GEB78765.1 hemolysin III [Desulfovibrio desulfuricans]HBW15008.1 hemolysin III [Desulfovibrio sp.]AAS97764.1 hemolysin III [Nitratidesulfovibrio vulgaris str. Hildenborough]ABM27123.1 channel protein, hemolysin III family [Nitratidesulfovibrio vulgaris DP4]ADP88186.1 channel protein, hemolysin III family [Nitratidesulfovibrio vulgaris RCH1]